MFVIVCIALVAIALAFVLPPLLQANGAAEENGAKEANIAIYRDQLRELEADLNNNIISKEQYAQDRDEIERRLLDDVSVSGATAKRGKVQAGSQNLGYALALAIPLVAVVFYFKVGNQNARTAPPPGEAAMPPAAAAPNGPGEMTPDRIAANVAALAKKLEDNPNDGPGWAMLARSYSQMQNYKEASAAFEKATALNPNDANLLAEYAYALSMARGRSMEGPPTELLEKALKLDPKNEKALALAGNAAFSAKNYKQAVEYWERLRATVQADPQLAQTLSERISEAKRLGKVK